MPVYVCDCPKVCKQPTEVGRTTYYSHAPYRAAGIAQSLAAFRSELGLSTRVPDEVETPDDSGRPHKRSRQQDTTPQVCARFCIPRPCIKINNPSPPSQHTVRRGIVVHPLRRPASMSYNQDYPAKMETMVHQTHARTYAQSSTTATIICMRSRMRSRKTCRGDPCLRTVRMGRIGRVWASTRADSYHPA